jgi:methyl-accepting chemotaxis protein
MSLSNMKVSAKMYAGFGISMVLMVIIITLSIYAMARIEENLVRIVTVNNIRTTIGNDMSEVVRENVISLRNILLVKDVKFRETEKNKIVAVMGKYDELLKKLTDMTNKDDAKGLGILEQIKTSEVAARSFNRQVIELALSGKDAEAFELSISKAAAAARHWLDAIDASNNYQEDRTRVRYDQATKAYDYARLVMIILGTITILLASLCAFFITRSITAPLNRVIAGLSDGSDQVAAASTQLSSASQSLAEGSSEQAASLEETSSAMEEMTSMTKQNADNAQLANNMMVKEAAPNFQMISERMKIMEKAMQASVTASGETAKIIKTIDEIAFQTNLLALNAAVEAARAGEAGAGFAVVADEVRNLAKRATEAAKNTQDLISNSTERIKEATGVYKQVSDAMDANGQIAQKVTTLITEIATASNEQSRGISEVSIAVNQMNQVTQQTAANAEESASASEELNAQAIQMRSLIGELNAVVSGRKKGNVLDRTLAATEDAENLVQNNAKLRPALRTQGGKTISLKKDKIKLSPKQLIPLEEGSFVDF